jgi:hypothetical protein
MESVMDARIVQKDVHVNHTLTKNNIFLLKSSELLLLVINIKTREGFLCWLTLIIRMCAMPNRTFRCESVMILINIVIYLTYMGIVYSLYYFPESKLSEYQKAGASDITSTIEKDLPIEKVTHHPSRIIPARQSRNPFTGEVIDRPEITTRAYDVTDYKQTAYIDKSLPFIEELIIPFIESQPALLGTHRFFNAQDDLDVSVFYASAAEVAEISKILQEVSINEIALKLAEDPDLREEAEEWFDYAQSYFKKIRKLYKDAADAGCMIVSIMG